MSQKFYPNSPLSEDPLADESPVLEPDPVINFDNVMNNEAEENEQPQAENPGGAAARQARAAGAAYSQAPAPDRCANCADAEKGRLLALAEMENMRKRLAREKEDFVKYAGEGIIADILPALDNLDLALAYAPEGKECQNFVVGVDMTRKLLLDALARHGLEQTGELGDQFDPACQEAVGMEPHPEFQNGQVCCLLSKGYRLKDRLLRPARVKVCKND